jgi:hypothetical protein
MIAGHMITIVIGRRPKIYVVSEVDAEQAVARLRGKLGMAVDAPLSSMPVSKVVMAEHDLRPGQVKQLHL